MIWDRRFVSEEGQSQNLALLLPSFSQYVKSLGHIKIAQYISATS